MMVGWLAMEDGMHDISGAKHGLWLRNIFLVIIIAQTHRVLVNSWLLRGRCDTSLAVLEIQMLKSLEQ
jgi:hypothetical protein